MGPKPTHEDMQKALDELVARGEIVGIEEINPRTRCVEVRYFVPECVPRPN